MYRCGGWENKLCLNLTGYVHTPPTSREMARTPPILILKLGWWPLQFGAYPALKQPRLLAAQIEPTGMPASLLWLLACGTVSYYLVPCWENNCWHARLIPARGGSVSAFQEVIAAGMHAGTHTHTHIPKFVGLFTHTKHLHTNLLTARSYVYVYILERKKKSHLKVTSHWYLFMPFIFCCAFF